MPGAGSGKKDRDSLRFCRCWGLSMPASYTSSSKGVGNMK